MKIYIDETLRKVELTLKGAPSSDIAIERHYCITLPISDMKRLIEFLYGERKWFVYKTIRFDRRGIFIKYRIDDTYLGQALVELR